MIHHAQARSLTIHTETLDTILEATGERRRIDLAYALHDAWIAVPTFLRRRFPSREGELRANLRRAEARFDRVACWWSCRLMEVEA